MIVMIDSDDHNDVFDGSDNNVENNGDIVLARLEKPHNFYLVLQAKTFQSVFAHISD